MTDAQKTPLSLSTFHMLRCVAALVHADHVIHKEEKQFLQTLVAYFENKFEISDGQKFQLVQDLRVAQNIDDLLPVVKDPRDRENLVLFAGMLAMADGETDPAEEVILRKIRAHAAEVQSSLPATVNGAPAVSRDELAEEVRNIVQQEFYRTAIQKSGIVQKSSALSVADAFVERGSLIHEPDVYAAVSDKRKPSVSTRRTLMGDERLVARARFHFAYTMETIIWSILAFILIHKTMPGLFQGVYYLQQSLNLPTVLVDRGFWTFMLRWLSWLVAGVIFAWRMLDMWSTEIILTDRRLLYKQGILFVKYTKIDLRQLFETVVNQSRLGAMLNYGSVFIYSNMVDTSLKGDKFDRNIVLPKIADPHTFASRVDRAKRILRTKGDV